jgi:predicted tellurium resistance membrane protein TerC
MADASGLLALLIGLEIVLGVDNLLVIAIGVTIFMAGLHKYVPKAYIDLPMGFALMVEMFQMRYEHNRRRKRA